MKTVLVIDDNEHVRRATREALRRWGYEATVAVDGVEGLRVAQEGDFDVILCDLEMPGLTGDRVYAQLSPEKQARFVLHTGNLHASQDFAHKMLVHEKSQSPSKLKSVLETLSGGAS